MKGQNPLKFLCIIVSAIVSSYAFMSLNVWLSFISFSFVFICFNKTGLKKSFTLGILFGFIYSFSLYYWMINGFVRYSAESFWWSFLFIVVSCGISALFFGLLFLISKMVWQQHTKTAIHYWINRIAIAAIWVLAEHFFNLLLAGFPLHSYRIGFVLSANTFFIQWASIGGLPLLGFIIILTNIIFADFIFTKKYKLLYQAIAIPTLCLFIGFIIYTTYQPKLTHKPFKVVSVSSNTDPKTKWSPVKVNQMANEYFALCKNAVAQNPDFIIWPESTLPWAYDKNDDLLNEILKISNQSKAIHVMGIADPITDEISYNAVYYLNEQNVLGTYYKKNLLKGIEKPFLNILLPFSYNEDFKLKEGTGFSNIKTIYGNAGTLICNESTSESAVLEQINDTNPHFFFNLSNDSWYSDYYVAEHHLYYNRLMSVEFRKDMAISNNRGFNAIVSSNGDVLKAIKKDTPTSIAGTLKPNNTKTLASIFPYGFLYLLTLILIINYFINFKYFLL